MLVRTGKMRQYGVDNAAFLAGQPGVGLDAALWLYDQGMAVLGSDTTGTEPQPVTDWDAHRPCGDAAGARRPPDRVAEPGDAGRGPGARVLFACLPLKLRGASGSWVRPVAIT